jgi:hypothetical protein
MVEGADQAMSLQIVSNADATGYVIVWQQGYKRTEWAVDMEDDLTAILQDILRTVEANHTAVNPVFLAPAERHPIAAAGPNEGAIRADREARQQEMALRNGGAALGKGLPFDGVPTMDDAALRSAPQPAGWNPVNYDNA